MHLPTLWQYSGGHALCASAPALPSRRQRRRQSNTLLTPTQLQHCPRLSAPGVLISLCNLPLLAFRPVCC